MCAKTHSYCFELFLAFDLSKSVIPFPVFTEIVGFLFHIIFKCVCVCVCVCTRVHARVYMYISTQKGPEILDLLKLELQGSGNQTWVLWKSSISKILGFHSFKILPLRLGNWAGQCEDLYLS